MPFLRQRKAMNLCVRKKMVWFRIYHLKSIIKTLNKTYLGLK